MTTMTYRNHLQFRFVLLGFTLTTSLLMAADKPATAPVPAPADKVAAAIASQDVVQVAPPRVQRFPAMTVFYKSTRTTISEMSKVAGPMMASLMKTARESGVQIEGSIMFIYHGASPDPTKPFDLDVAAVVIADAKPAGDFKVKQLPAFNCVSTVYCGPVYRVGEAYGQLIAQCEAAGVQPADETREMYLYWEAMDSPNNVTLVQVGIK